MVVSGLSLQACAGHGILWCSQVFLIKSVTGLIHRFQFQHSCALNAVLNLSCATYSCAYVLQYFDKVGSLHAGLDQLNTISCATCTGFTPAAVRAIGSMQGLVELNLRGYMPLGSLQSLTALQALTGSLRHLLCIMAYASLL